MDSVSEWGIDLRKNTLILFILAILAIAFLLIINSTLSFDSDSDFSDTDGANGGTDTEQSEEVQHSYVIYNYKELGLTKDYHAWEDYCESKGGHLAVINDAAENQVYWSTFFATLWSFETTCNEPPSASNNCYVSAV